jgi:hypothetical protein
MGTVFTIVQVQEPVQLEQCAVCALLRPVSQTEFRDMTIGYYVCKDTAACNVRWHLEICAHLLRVNGKPNRCCNLCMAGTVDRKTRMARAIAAVRRDCEHPGVFAGEREYEHCWTCDTDVPRHLL